MIGGLSGAMIWGSLVRMVCVSGKPAVIYVTWRKALARCFEMLEALELSVRLTVLQPLQQS